MEGRAEGGMASQFFTENPITTGGGGADYAHCPYFWTSFAPPLQGRRNNMVRTDLAAPVVLFRQQMVLRSVFKQKLLVSACSHLMMI